MTILLSADDPAYAKEINISSLKSSQMNFIFSGANTDLIDISNFTFADVQVPSADVVRSSINRGCINSLYFNSDIEYDICAVTESPFNPSVTGHSALGFSTQEYATEVFDKVTQEKPYGTLIFNTESYSDMVQIETYTLSGDMLDATINRPEYFDASLLFAAPRLSDINTYLQIEDTSIPLVGELPDLTKCRRVQLEGIAKNDDYTFLVLDPELTRILHKTDMTEGHFERLTQVDTDEVVVVAIAKHTGKHSFAFKSINIAGAPSI